MSLPAADYQGMLLNLLPYGPAWPREDSQSSRLLDGMAQELARLDGRGDVLVEEADPRTTAELLTDWERVAGLPDTCAPIDESLTDAQRRVRLTYKLTLQGGQSRAFFVALALQHGYTVSIDEYVPQDCESDCEYPIYGDDWQFAWRVNAGNTPVYEADCEDSCEQPLATWGKPELECLLNQVKPAHTTIIFTYSSRTILGLTGGMVLDIGSLFEIL